MEAFVAREAVVERDHHAELMAELAALRGALTELPALQAEVAAQRAELAALRDPASPEPA